MSYNYVCDPAAPFEQQPQQLQQQQQHLQEDRRSQPPQESQEAAESAGVGRPTSLRGSRRSGSSGDVRDTLTDRIGSRSDRSARIQLPEGSIAGWRDPLLVTPPPPREGEIRLCSAKASICRTLVLPTLVQEETPSTLLPHVGPQMTGNSIYPPWEHRLVLAHVLLVYSCVPLLHPLQCTRSCFWVPAAFAFPYLFN